MIKQYRQGGNVLNINKEKVNKINNAVIEKAGILLAIFVIGFFGGWLGSRSRDYQKSVDNDSIATKTVVKESELISDLAKKVSPSVVSVNVKSSKQTVSFFGLPETSDQESAGSGIVISTDGLILTNRHVVPRGTTDVSVTLSDGTELDDVEVVGRTNSNDPLDVAFLKIKDSKGKKLQKAEIGDSSKMQVGDKVIAIGNALGQFQNTVTSGIVSGYGRNVQASDDDGRGAENLQNLFQTDAAINQGNSGGPLVNMSGQVIGVNTAVAGGGAENIGFAIPINDVKGLVDTVLSKGELLRPYLGVRYLELTDDYASELEIDQKRGAYIVDGTTAQPSIIQDSPADKAGLQEKDIIVKVGNDTVDENNSLTSLLQKHQVGDTIELTIIRDGKEQKVSVKLEATPKD